MFLKASQDRELQRLLPPLAFTGSEDAPYSKRLDDALSFSIGYAVDVPNPRLRYLEMGEAPADRLLTWLRSKYGEEVDSLQPVVEQFERTLEGQSL